MIIRYNVVRATAKEILQVAVALHQIECDAGQFPFFIKKKEAYIPCPFRLLEVVDAFSVVISITNKMNVFFVCVCVYDLFQALGWTTHQHEISNS